MDRRCAGTEGGLGRAHGVHDLVFGPDEPQRFLRAGRRFGGDDRHCVADAARNFSHGNHGRPVGDDAADVAIARNVQPGCSDDHARKRPGGRDIKGEQPGPRVRRAQNRTEEHAGLRQIVDIPGPATNLQGCIDAQKPRSNSGTGGHCRCACGRDLPPG
jgi:hypothetical protein